MTTQSIIFYVGGCYGAFFEWLFAHHENPGLVQPAIVDHRQSIIDESWIQQRLYNNQIGIKCHKLDVFPTNTADFLPLLEKI
jgi:hypothetical protein